MPKHNLPADLLARSPFAPEDTGTISVVFAGHHPIAYLYNDQHDVQHTATVYLYDGETVHEYHGQSRHSRDERLCGLGEPRGLSWFRSAGGTPTWRYSHSF